MKIHVRHKLFFYECRNGVAGSGLEVVSPFANLADYHGKTLFVSETVECTFCILYSLVLLAKYGVQKGG